jgi:Ser/Thr protein kinase RdoA (MazF antagonist)
MSPSHLDSDAAAALLRYPSFCRQGTLTPLGNHGGFSGATLWRIDAPAGALCLRAGPPHEIWPRLLFRHRLMSQARQSGLAFVPTIVAAVDGATAVEQAGRLWELSEWLPGCSDFHRHPSMARLEAACAALAQLHTVWRSQASRADVCPAVQRRLTFLGEWQQLLRSGWYPLAIAGPSDPLRPILERAWRLLPDAIEQVPQRLQRWLGGPSPSSVQPCLCDVWHDHLLFEGDRLTGLIDFGAVKVDHVAVDLARMLGSLVRDDVEGWRLGLQAYRRLAPLTAEEEELAHALDETGIVMGMANWLRWLYAEQRQFADRSAVACRLRELLVRLESFEE